MIAMHICNGKAFTESIFNSNKLLLKPKGHRWMEILGYLGPVLRYLGYMEQFKGRDTYFFSKFPYPQFPLIRG